MSSGNLFTTEYKKDGKLHREGDKPAHIIKDAQGNVLEEEYFKDNQLHRDGDKPAHIIKDVQGRDGEEHTPKPSIEIGEVDSVASAINNKAKTK